MIDYDEVFALITRLETIQLIIATVAQYRLRIYKIDVKSTFLNGFSWKGGLYWATYGIWSEGTWRQGIKVKQSLVWIEVNP